MKKHSSISILLFLLGLGICFSCAKPDSSLPTGTYYGILPCADCPGLKYSLEIFQDSTYSETMFYLERSEQEIRSQGKIKSWTGDRLVLNKEGGGFHSFVIHKDSLQVLDQNGAAIEGDLAALYWLTAKKPENFDEIHKEKGFIGFKATGNEPFWSLKMDFSGKMVLDVLGEEEFSVPLPKPVKPQDIQAEHYNAQTEKGQLQVTIFKQKCQDSMSGMDFDYKVSVRVKTNEEAEYREYSGCGSYQGDYRLNDIWVLESVNGLAVSKEFKAPNIEFNLQRNQFFGFGGCNRINGNLSMAGQVLTFKDLVTTNNSCERLSEEQQFLQLIDGKSFRFAIQPRGLRLYNTDDSLEFRKVD